MSHAHDLQHRRVAVVREAECIGCTKCIPACPHDAIQGAPKQVHTVLHENCTGCDLCLDPCPVDCIDMLDLPLPPLAPYHSPLEGESEAQGRSPPRLRWGDQSPEPLLPLITRAEARSEIAAAVARERKRLQ